MTNTKDASRAEFEAWAVTDASPLFPNEIENPFPDGLYRTSGANAAWTTWQAARASSINSQLDSNTLKKMAFLSESKSMRPVGVVMIDDATSQRATIDMGRVTWTEPTTKESSAVLPVEPTIDGYPLWSGLPPPERVALSDDEVWRIYQRAINSVMHTGGRTFTIALTRAILATQADHIEDKLAMVKPFCADCGKRNFADHIHTCTPPIAESALDDGYELTTDHAMHLFNSPEVDFIGIVKASIGQNMAPAFNQEELDLLVEKGTKAWAGHSSKRDDVAGDAAVRFAGMVLATHRNDGCPGDVDGADLQEMALKCGLIEERTVTERCGEFCICGEVATFPLECFFNTDAGCAAIAASTAKESP